MRRRFVCLLFAAVVLAADRDEWASRTVYQVLTDRFGLDGKCGSLNDYCGGTWKTLASHLDYIEGMGFDAVWISPVIDNLKGGYHGYWGTDFTSYNPHFGTEADLRLLRDALHSRGMLLMVDVVANHVACVPNDDWKLVRPFNRSSNYHSCEGCPQGCRIKDFQNQPQVELCRLSGLPDLNQSDPETERLLLASLRDVSGKYADGFRVDTTPEVSKTFWKAFTKAVAPKFSLGEVYDGRVDYVAGYQGPLSSVLSYPMFFTSRDVFASKGSMRALGNRMQEYGKSFADLDALGNFADNHDQKRFLNVNSDFCAYKNALTWTLFSRGIPVVYYGSEQKFSGGSDPACREALTTSLMDTHSDMYSFLKAIIEVRKARTVWKFEQVERWQDDSVYAFTRGNVFVALTNVGSKGVTQNRMVTYHPYPVGTDLCNIFHPEDDCITVGPEGIKLVLQRGEPKIFVPKP